MYEIKEEYPERLKCFLARHNSFIELVKSRPSWTATELRLKCKELKLIVSPNAYSELVKQYEKKGELTTKKLGKYIVVSAI